MDDEEWEVGFHFLDKDNLERTICLSDITFWNLIALIEVEGYSSRDFMYSVRDPGVGVSGMEELTDDDKVEKAIEVIGEYSRRRTEVVPSTASYDIGRYASFPVEVQVGGATIFVVDVEKFVKL